MYIASARICPHKVTLLAFLAVFVVALFTLPGGAVAQGASTPAQCLAEHSPCPSPLEPAPMLPLGLAETEACLADAEAERSSSVKAPHNFFHQQTPLAWHAQYPLANARFMPIPALLLAARAPIAEGLHARPPPRHA